MNTNLRGTITESLSGIAKPFLELVGNIKSGKIATDIKTDLEKLSEHQVVVIM